MVFCVDSFWLTPTTQDAWDTYERDREGFPGFPGRCLQCCWQVALGHSWRPVVGGSDARGRQLAVVFEERQLGLPLGELGQVAGVELLVRFYVCMLWGMGSCMRGLHVRLR